MTEKERAELETIREKNYNLLQSVSIDFVGDYDLTTSGYISDLISEYADSRTSIYYSDQHRYFEENSKECESALLEIYSDSDIAEIIKKEGLYNLICKAGAIGEFRSIETILFDDTAEILTVLICDYLLKIDFFMDEEQIEDLIYDDFARLSDYVEKIDEFKDEK